jgi:hypothetical protein
MAAVTPVTGNHCRGTYANGDPDIQLKCLKETDDDGNPVYTCATMKLFKANCPKNNRQCSQLSSAWVPAVTVCAQRLY